MPCNFVEGSGSVLLAVAGVYKFVVPFGLLMNCAKEFEELESHGKCPEIDASGEVIVDLRHLPCARLRRLAVNYCSLVPFVNTELKRREIQKYMGYSESKLRNIRAAVCNLNFETTPAKMARQELVRRGIRFSTPGGCRSIQRSLHPRCTLRPQSPALMAFMAWRAELLSSLVEYHTSWCPKISSWSPVKPVPVSSNCPGRHSDSSPAVIRGNPAAPFLTFW